MLLFLFKPVSTKKEFLACPHIFFDCLNTNSMIPRATASKQTMQKIFIATVELPLENTE